MVVGVRAVAAHRVPGARDDLNREVWAPQVSQPLPGAGRDQHLVVTAAGDQQSRPGEGRGDLDPGRLPGDLLPICQRRVELCLGHCPRTQLGPRPQRKIGPAPGQRSLQIVTERLDRLLEPFRRRWPGAAVRSGEPRRILQHGSPDQVRPGGKDGCRDTGAHGVTDQYRRLVTLDCQILEQQDNVGDHVVEPVAAGGGGVEAR